MKKRLTVNTITPILQQLATIISGFVVPRLILDNYGSNVNGLVSSINQFLSIISFLEAGVGSVIRYNLYKPLVENDNLTLSKVIISASDFFKVIAKILIVYTIVLMVFYPAIIRDSQQFGYFYTALLIASMSISYLSQYYFGQINQLLLTADQKGYVQYTAQVLTIILNMIVCVILINCGAGIHIVKFSASIIFLIRPIYLQMYVKKHYKINYKITLTEEPIKQKWNGFAQHISAVVLESTDVIILTVFSTLSNVSIYSAYNMVVYGIKTLMSTATTGIEALVGNIHARNNKEELNKVFSLMEWCIHTIGVFLFGCTGILILPFVMVYTRGINDVNYSVPLFAVLITIANLSHTLRMPYHICILSGGYYKQTQSSYMAAAVLNIVVSTIFVKRLGLIGVAIGTIVAMGYQTIWMSYFSYKSILLSNYKKFLKQMIINIISIALMFLMTYKLNFYVASYLEWFLLAVKVAITNGFISICINLIFYRHNLETIRRQLFTDRK